MKQSTTGRSRVSAPDGSTPAPAAVNGSPRPLAGLPDATAGDSRSHVLRRTVCPICATTFEPRASGGQCPVCGEQVVPAAAAARQIAVLSPAMRWLADGGWRLVLVLLLAAYQLALLIFVWIQLAHKHLM